MFKAWRMGKDGAAFFLYKRLRLDVGYSFGSFCLELLTIDYVFGQLSVRVALGYVYAQFVIKPKQTVF